jgi:DNA-directed RNA polymerase subunit E'/Rpb7
MFFLVPIEKIIRIEPYELGKNLELKIRRKYSLYKLKPPPL